MAVPDSPARQETALSAAEAPRAISPLQPRLFRELLRLFEAIAPEFYRCLAIDPPSFRISRQFIDATRADLLSRYDQLEELASIGSTPQSRAGRR